MISENGEKLRCSFCGKICYTQREAGYLLNTRSSHSKHREKVPRRKYFCKQCGYYHLTSEFKKLGRKKT